MFPCACSLRSTQCAALIALAAAAGIMRIEPAQTNAARNPMIAEELARSTASVPGRFTSTFEAPANAYAPWLQWIQVAKQMAAYAASPDVTLPVFPPESAKRRPCVSSAAPPPSARQHAYPFAIGPPRRGATWTPRADDTDVSGDSAVRRRLISGFAAASLQFSARLSCNRIPVPTLAGLISEPSFAPRGEPDWNDSLLASIEPAGLCPERRDRVANCISPS